MRHGAEWDHLAAIFDMTSTVQTSSSSSVRPSIGKNFSRTMSLTGLYAIGHGCAVIALGLLIKQMTNYLPSWLDRMMEMIVGGTLIALGAWTIYAVCKSLSSSEHRHLQSRWALIFQALRQLKNRLLKSTSSTSEYDSFPPAACTPRMAFGVGVIHGIGIETSTQIILLTTASSLSHSVDCWLMLLSFVGGLVFANSLVAVLYLAGALTALSIRPVYLGLGLLTGTFSVFIGLVFLLHLAHILPALSFYCPRIAPINFVLERVT